MVYMKAGNVDSDKMGENQSVPSLAYITPTTIRHFNLFNGRISYNHDLECASLIANNSRSDNDRIDMYKEHTYNLDLRFNKHTYHFNLTYFYGYAKRYVAAGSGLRLKQVDKILSTEKPHWAFHFNLKKIIMNYYPHMYKKGS